MKVLFLCPHGAAKSVLAAAMMRDRARRRRLDVTASNAGTDPDDEVNPIALRGLRTLGLEYVETPRRVTRRDVEHADMVVSLGCALSELPVEPVHFIDWSDVPDASDDLDGLIRTLSVRLDSLLC